MIKKNKTLVYLFLSSAFLAGMIIGMMAKSEETGGITNPIFSFLIFSTGLSVGAFITRLQREFKEQSGSNSHTETTTNN